MRLVATALSFVALCAAAEPEVTGPILGYIYDAPSKSIRRVNGIAGAATMGDTIEASLDIAAVSALGKTSISCSEAAGVRVRALESSTPIALGGFAGCPDALVLSPMGTAALSRAGDSLLVTSGLPGAARNGAVLTAPESATTFAISDSGAVVYAATGGVLWRSENAGPWTKVLTAEGLTAPSFVPDSNSAVVGADGKVWSIADTGETRLLAEAERATAVLAAKDAIFVAIGSRLRAIRADGSMAEYEAPVEIGALDHMDGQTVRITRIDQSPIRLFVPASGQFLFIPAMEAPNE
jgi:hypothetical protein